MSEKLKSEHAPLVPGPNLSPHYVGSRWPRVSCSPTSLHPRHPAEGMQRNDIISNMKSTMIDYILKEKEKHVFFCALHILNTPGFHYRIQKKGLTDKIQRDADIYIVFSVFWWIKSFMGDSLVVQWFRFNTSNGRDVDLTPGWGIGFYMLCGIAKKT